MSYSEKRNQWLEIMCGDDIHSIRSQLQNMAWQAASYHTINEARRISTQSSDGENALNGLLFDLFDTGYLQTQAISIRKLSENNPVSGPRGIYSLHSILLDMKNHLNVITRGNIFASEGLEYDTEKVRQERDKYAIEMHWKVLCHNVPNELRWENLEERHQQLDYIFQCQPHQRTREDKADAPFFDKLIKRITSNTESIDAYVNKVIAHAATPESRDASRHTLIISLQMLWRSLRALSITSTFVSKYILGCSLPPVLSIPQYDLLESIDKPLIEIHRIEELKRFWLRLDKMSGRWMQFKALI